MIVDEVCNQCPITRGADIIGLEKGRVNKIKASQLENDYWCFMCHKTIVDGNEKMCRGMAEYLKEMGRPNIAMRLSNFK